MPDADLLLTRPDVLRKDERVVLTWTGSKWSCSYRRIPDGRSHHAVAHPGDALHPFADNLVRQARESGPPPKPEGR
jgi:hypothetical protein